MIARAAASESNLSFFACSASTLTSKWVGESEKLVRALFIVAKRLGPSIVFLDELDSILSARGRSTNENESSRRLKTEFMVQVDGVRTNSGGSGEKEEGHTGGSDCNNSHVLVLGCSNCPWDLDQAVLRRFERRIYVPLPDDDARQCMMSKLLESNRHNLSPRQLGKLVALTEGYSCSDLISLGSEASFGPLRSLGGMMDIINAKHVCSSNDLRPISFEDFETALSNGKQRRSVSGDLLKKYAAWETEQSI
uniref:ATPase AAA-type core domain-containing protein n=1 Tax=Proboscia inermis TaxID=420281 RepID=A0A7S0C402_9STRA